LSQDTDNKPMKRTTPSNNNGDFELVINGIAPDKKQYTVFCEELLRDVPGKRSVYRGKWQNKPVIIKIFKKCFGSKRRLLAEWQGLNELKKRNINTAEAYFYGRCENGDWVLVLEEICDSATALDKFEFAETSEAKLEIIEMLVDELAKLNKAGIVQADLHLGNFLIRGATVYPLDTAGMKFLSDSLDRNESIKQIALLCWYIPAGAAEFYDRFLDQYAKSRGWKFDEKDKASACLYADKHNIKAVKKGLRKCLRTSKRQIKIKIKNYMAVFDRDFHSKIDVKSLMEKIDEIMGTGRILKNGRTCFVSSFNYQGVEVVAKRYNNKGFLHTVRQTIKRSRARKAWLNGHLLQMLKINTPKPLAFIIVYKNSLIWKSYILTEFVDGINLHHYFQQNVTGENEKQKIKNGLNSIVDTLHQNRITHGDIKKSNILIADSRICITDLDAMIRHKPASLYLHHKNKDMRRFELLCDQL